MRHSYISRLSDRSATFFVIIKSISDILFLFNLKIKFVVVKTTEAQLSKITQNFKSCNPQKWLPYRILCIETVKNVQIDPQTKDI